MYVYLQLQRLRKVDLQGNQKNSALSSIITNYSDISPVKNEVKSVDGVAEVLVDVKPSEIKNYYKIFVSCD